MTWIDELMVSRSLTCDFEYRVNSFILQLFRCETVCFIKISECIISLTNPSEYSVLNSKQLQEEIVLFMEKILPCMQNSLLPLGLDAVSGYSETTVQFRVHQHDPFK